MINAASAHAIRQMGGATRRDGYTLVEVMLASALSALLLVMVSGITAGFGRALSDTVAQARANGEANLALESLRRDFGGSLPGENTGAVAEGRLVGHMAVAGSEVGLCFDGGSANGSADWARPDTVIFYRVLDGELLRFDSRENRPFVVARHVQDLVVKQEGSTLRIELTCRLRNYKRTFVVVAGEL